MDKQFINASDESIMYYLISSKWMAIWRKFANGETSQPGKIAN